MKKKIKVIHFQPPYYQIKIVDKFKPKLIHVDICDDYAHINSLVNLYKAMFPEPRHKVVCTYYPMESYECKRNWRWVK